MARLIDPVAPDLSDWQQSLGRFSAGADERITRMLTMAAETVAGDARTLVPRGPSGAARASLGVRQVSGDPAVAGGGSKAPYYPWLEFGGAVGRKESVRRTVVPGGRYIFPTWMKNRTDILTAMERGMADLAKESGFG